MSLETYHTLLDLRALDIIWRRLRRAGTYVRQEPGKQSQRPKMLFFRAGSEELLWDSVLFAVPGGVSGFGAVGNALDNNLSSKTPTVPVPVCVNHMLRALCFGDFLWF